MQYFICKARNWVCVHQCQALNWALRTQKWSSLCFKGSCGLMTKTGRWSLSGGEIDHHSIHFVCSFSSLDTTWIWAGPVGLPEVEVSPVYLIKGLTLGQCRLPEGGQCHQCGIEEEGTEGVETWTIWRQSWAWWASWSSSWANLSLGWTQQLFAMKQVSICLYLIYVPGT